MNAMLRIQRDSPVPLYLQLEQLLRHRIEHGQLNPGDMLPSEQELQEQLGISRTTVRQALRELEVAGLITRYRGRGTFVAPPKVSHGPDPRHSISEHLEAAGMQPGWVLLSQGEVPASEPLAERMGVALGSPVFCLKRLRLADSEPIGHLVSWVSTEVEIDRSAMARGGSLLYLGNAIAEAEVERVIEAVAAEAESAMFLGVDPGAPMLRIRRKIVSREGKVIEDFCGTYRGDRFQYQINGALP